MQRKIGAQQLQLEIELEQPATRPATPTEPPNELLSANGDTAARRVPACGRTAPRTRGGRAASAPSADELLHNPDALLTRTHLRLLGLERRAIDAVFRALPVVALPGYTRPMILARDYLDLVDDSTYHGDRVRPIARAS